jgi:hypothetical protein
MAEIGQQFLDKGYCVAEGLDIETVDTIRSRFAAVVSGVAQSNEFGNVDNDADMVRLYAEQKDLWIAAVDQLPFLPELLGSCSDPRLLALARQAGIRFPGVSGGGVSLLVNIPADDERLYRQHQDIAYIPGSLNGITIWVPLQDSPVELGPLEVVPGTHRIGLLLADGNPDVKKANLLQPYPESDFVPIPILKGQCIVFSKFLVHRSGRNRSPNVRYSLQFRYNDLASPEYLKRKLTFNALDTTDTSMRYAIDA